MILADYSPFYYKMDKKPPSLVRFLPHPLLHFLLSY